MIPMGERADNDADRTVRRICLGYFLRHFKTVKNKFIHVAKMIAGWTGRTGDHNMDSSKAGKDLKVCKNCCRNCLCDFVARRAARKPRRKGRRRMGQQLKVRR